MSLIDYFRKKTHTENQAAPTEETPYRAKVGSGLRLQKLPFIRAQTSGSLVVAPDALEDRIIAISRLKLGSVGDLYRYHLQTEETSDTPKFLQVYRDGAKEVKEAVYYSALTSFVPETREEQNLFTGRAGAGLGDIEYTLSKDQLSFLDEDTLNRVFKDVESITFTRDAGGTAQFVQPYTAQETRVEDNEGVHGLHQDTFFLPYARDLSDGSKECLLITTNMTEDSDGEKTRTITVCFYVGIPIELERIDLV